VTAAGVLLALTVPEIRRLLVRLLPVPQPDQAACWPGRSGADVIKPALVGPTISDDIAKCGWSIFRAVPGVCRKTLQQ